MTASNLAIDVAAESAEQLADIDKRIEEHGRSTRAD
jgi:hypothetical protein